MSQRQSGYARQPNDQYETPPWCIEVLIRHLPGRISSIHDPAAGGGNIVDTITAETDILITGSDLSNGIDFLQDGTRREAIVMNPPYAAGEKFIVHALEIADFVAALLRVDFDSAKTRRHLFGDCPRFAKKLILTRRIIWFDRPGAAPSFNHSWFLWDRDHRGPATLAYTP